ncbi:YciE/YciF ferroxidase family protein [Echinicola salinicaeni]|uniref:YciE/YciF ferroxidase family protein n=1 Tax=Echinicola salinicaeni TaxID=2762757 RepID=UPI00164934DB|nr:DUF892 family protein [Echinicola salinicaeni]
MKSIHNLEELFFEQLKEQYHATREQFETYPKLRDKTSNSSLQEAIDFHIGHARNQMERIDHIFNSLNRNRHGEENLAVKGLIQEAIELAQRCTDPAARDAGIIASIQHYNHYNIASYGILSTYAKELNLDDSKKALHLSLQEEKTVDQHLSALAEKVVNLDAIH